LVQKKVIVCISLLSESLIIVVDDIKYLLKFLVHHKWFGSTILWFFFWTYLLYVFILRQLTVFFLPPFIWWLVFHASALWWKFDIWWSSKIEVFHSMRARVLDTDTKLKWRINLIGRRVLKIIQLGRCHIFGQLFLFNWCDYALCCVFVIILTFFI